MTEQERFQEHLNNQSEILGRFMMVVGNHIPELQDDIKWLVGEWQRIGAEIEADYEASKSRIVLP